MRSVRPSPDFFQWPIAILTYVMPISVKSVNYRFCRERRAASRHGLEKPNAILIYVMYISLSSTSFVGVKIKVNFHDIKSKSGSLLQASMHDLTVCSMSA